MTTLDRKQVLHLYDNAKCSGESALFSSASREAFELARTRCAECPVLQLCEQHVMPQAELYTGTCAGKFWYDGEDVTHNPLAKPPPVFRVNDVNLEVATALIDGTCDEWAGHSAGTLMAACWRLRQAYTLNRISKLSGLEKIYVGKLVQAFDDGAPVEFRDFIADQPLDSSSQDR